MGFTVNGLRKQFDQSFLYLSTEKRVSYWNNPLDEQSSTEYQLKRINVQQKEHEMYTNLITKLIPLQIVQGRHKNNCKLFYFNEFNLIIVCR